MIRIEITTDTGDSWEEPYSGTADQARAELMGQLVEVQTDDLGRIVKVERVDHAY
jgi:hypothetical protein